MLKFYQVNFAVLFNHCIYTGWGTKICSIAFMLYTHKFQSKEKYIFNKFLHFCKLQNQSFLSILFDIHHSG